MEQLVLLLVIAAISLVNWLIERSGKLREQRRLQKEADNRGETSPTSATPLPQASPREEIEEHMRRMMESFGFPVEDPAAAIEKQQPLVEVVQPASPPPLPKPASVIEKTWIQRSKQVAAVSRVRSPWLKRLDSPSGLQEAVVLREILGPPKALCEP